MGIMTIRKVAQKILAPVIIVLVVTLTVGMFYIGIPAFSKEVYSYRGKAVKLGNKVLKDGEFQQFLERAYLDASQLQQWGEITPDAQIRDNALIYAAQYLAFQNEMEKVKDKLKVTNKEAEDLVKKAFPTEEELKSFMLQRGLNSKKDVLKLAKEDLKNRKFILLKGKEFKVKVDKNDVLEQLEQLTLSQILVGYYDSDNKERTEAQALARANEVYAKVTGGGDFGELAKQYSDDANTKDKNGVYGPVSLAVYKAIMQGQNMEQEFVDAVLALKEGEITKPIKTTHGYYIVRLDKREMPTGDAYKTKYREVEESLLYEKTIQDEKFQNWAKKINEDAESKMEILDPALRGYRLSLKEKWAEAASAYEKAFKLKYYKKNWSLYIETSNIYLKLKDFDKALSVLKKVPAEGQDSIEYQIALATVYKENNKPKKAEEILTAYGNKNPEDKYIHQQLQEQFTTWKMTKAAQREAEIVAKLEKKEQEELEAYQKQLNESNNTNNDNQTESK